MTVNANKGAPKSVAFRRTGNATMTPEQESNNKDVKKNTAMAVKRRAVGLVNLGNTCFMNAALQCLCRTPGLLTKLKLLAENPTVAFDGSTVSYNPSEEMPSQMKFSIEIPSDSMVRKMVDLLEKMTEGSTTGAVNPRAVHCVMARTFGAGLQHDSHELLRHILDKLKKDQIRAFRVALMDLFGVPRSEAAKMQQTNPNKAVEIKEWDRKLFHTTVVDDLFGGRLVTTRTCLECRSVKTSYEEFLDLSLPIRVVKSNSENGASTLINNRFSLLHEVPIVNRTLYECLRCFAEPETLSGNNSVDCEKCHEAKLNQVKAGRPIQEVFPQPPPPVLSCNLKNKNDTNGTDKKFSKSKKCPGNAKKEDHGDEKVEAKPGKQRKRRKRKTRAEKVAEDSLPSRIEKKAVEGLEDDADQGNGSSTSEPEGAEAEKISDEGYAEDFKETDDSSGTSASVRSHGTNNDAGQDDGGADGEDDDEEGSKDDKESDKEHHSSTEEEKLPPEPVIPKSTKSACSRQTMISKPPQNLTIHLKRFTVSAKGFTCKLADHVKFEEYIDIRDYIKADLPQYEDYESGDASEAGAPSSPASWSFDELALKDPDVLGGGSGDTVIDHPSSSHILPLPSSSKHSKISEEPLKLPQGSASWNCPAIIYGDQSTILEDRVVPDCLNTTIVSEEEVVSSEVIQYKNPSEGTISSTSNPMLVFGPMTETDAKEQDASTLSSGYRCFYEIDSLPEKLAPESHSLKSIGDVSPIQRNVPEVAKDNATSLCDSTHIEEAVDPSLVDDNGIDTYPGAPDEYDDEPPPYPGSPCPLEDEDEGTSNKIDLNLPLTGDEWSIGYKSPIAIARWTASKSNDYLELGYDPFEDTLPMEPLLADELGHEPSYTDAPDTTLEFLGKSRLPSYQEITGEVDSPAANIWGTTINSTKGELNDSPPAYEANDSKIPLPPPLPTYTATRDSYSVLSSNQLRDHDSSSANDFDNNFTAPPAVIPLGYQTNPLSITETPTVLDEFESQGTNVTFSPTLTNASTSASGYGGSCGVHSEEVNEKNEPVTGIMDPNGINYRLYGIVEHGGSLNWGHYVAYVRVGTDWYYISDSCVSSSDISTVLSRDPYILFYERVV